MQSGRNLVQSILRILLAPSLSLFPCKYSWSRFSPRQHWIAPVCNLSFCRRMFLPILNQIFSLSKLRWLQTPTGFDGFFFFPPWHACFQKRVGILPEMSTVTPTFGELYFFFSLYIFSLISGGREPTGIYHSTSHPVFSAAAPSLCIMLGNSGKV